MSTSQLPTLLRRNYSISANLTNTFPFATIKQFMRLLSRLTAASLIEYPLTREFPLPFSLALIIVGLLWSGFITTVIVVFVGYEYVPGYTTTFNSTESLWYAKFLGRTAWMPPFQTCQPAIIGVENSIVHLFAR